MRLLKHCFFKKRINIKLIRNNRHQMKSLRESFLPQYRATEAFHYPENVIRLQKKTDKHRQKQKICAKVMHENDVPPINSILS